MTQTEIDFEKLFGRPGDYHLMSEADQWETDKALGILDVWLDESQLTDEMRARYTQYFGLTPGTAT